MKLLKSYLFDVWTITCSSLLVYRNFFHWNLSKIVIYLYAIISSIVCAVIPAGLTVYLWYAFTGSLNQEALVNLASSWDLAPELLSQVIAGWWMIVLMVILGVITLSVFIFFFAYAYFLLSKVHDSYLTGEKLPIKKNAYFSWFQMGRFFMITAWTSWYMLIPVLIWLFAILAVALIQIITGIQIANISNGASIATGIIFVIASIIAFVWFLRIAIRCSFAVFLALDAPATDSGKYLVHKSFEMTRGKIWRLIFLSIPLLIVLSIVEWVVSNTESALAKNRAYSYLDSVRSESGTGFTNDFEFLSGYYKEWLSDDESIDILRAQAKYEEKKDSIRKEYFDAVYSYLDTDKIDPYKWASDFLFGILYLLFLEGLQSMMYLSIYRNSISGVGIWKELGVRNS